MPSLAVVLGQGQQGSRSENILLKRLDFTNRHHHDALDFFKFLSILLNSSLDLVNNS